MQTGPCDIYVSVFNTTVNLSSIGNITTYPAANIYGIPANSCATLPISINVLRSMFSYTSSTYSNGNSILDGHWVNGSSTSDKIIGDVGNVNSIACCIRNNLLSAFNEYATSSKNPSISVSILNPACALVPLNHTINCLALCVNGTINVNYFEVQSMNNSGLETIGTRSLQKGAMIVTSDSGSPLVAAQNQVKIDFLRYISYELFNTPRAISLFSNQIEVFNNIDSICQTDYVNINAILTVSPTKCPSLNANIITASKQWYWDNTGRCFTICDSCDSSSTNVCAKLASAMFSIDHTRFASDVRELIPNTTNQYYLPFRDQDTIRHTLTLVPAAQQGNVVADGPGVIASRTYEIIWVVVDDTVLGRNSGQSGPVTVEYGVLRNGLSNVVYPF